MLEYAKEQLPQLGEFDIAVESQDGSKRYWMASNTDVETLKTIFCVGATGIDCVSVIIKRKISFKIILLLIKFKK